MVALDTPPWDTPTLVTPLCPTPHPMESEAIAPMSAPMDMVGGLLERGLLMLSLRLRLMLMLTTMETMAMVTLDTPPWDTPTLDTLPFPTPDPMESEAIAPMSAPMDMATWDTHPLDTPPCPTPGPTPMPPVPTSPPAWATDPWVMLPVLILDILMVPTQPLDEQNYLKIPSSMCNFLSDPVTKPEFIFQK